MSSAQQQEREHGGQPRRVQAPGRSQLRAVALLEGERQIDDSGPRRTGWRRWRRRRRSGRRGRRRYSARRELLRCAAMDVPLGGAGRRWHRGAALRRPGRWRKHRRFLRSELRRSRFRRGGDGRRRRACGRRRRVRVLVGSQRGRRPRLARPDRDTSGDRPHPRRGRGNPACRRGCRPARRPPWQQL